jgi:hypothetical protein
LSYNDPPVYQIEDSRSPIYPKPKLPAIQKRKKADKKENDNIAKVKWEK